MSYEKDKIDSFVTSASLSSALTTALAPYITSASVSAAIAGISLGGYVTSNSLSAAVATDTLTVRGPAAVSATLSAGAVTVSGYPVGSVLLAYQAVNNIATIGFSGSWSDYAILELRTMYRMSGTATCSIQIFTDGGGTPILSIQSPVSGPHGAVPVALNVNVIGGDGIANKHLDARWMYNDLSAEIYSATANSGFVNCIRVLQSKTMSQGVAMLIGYRKA